jgi:DNA (cytosine-5)-methyltransferase 1
VYDPAGLAKTLLSKSGGLGGKTGLYAVGFNRRQGMTGEIDTAHTLLAGYYKGFSNQTQNAVLHIKEATKRGYKEAVPGDSVNTSYAGQNQKRGRVGKGVANTLDTGCSQGVVTLCGRIRRLMPRECFRLQGFTDAQIDRLLEGSSDTQAYKQAGNAVTVNVVHALALRLKSAHEAAVATTRARQAAA